MFEPPSPFSDPAWATCVQLVFHAFPLCRFPEPAAVRWRALVERCLGNWRPIFGGLLWAPRFERPTLGGPLGRTALGRPKLGRWVPTYMVPCGQVGANLRGSLGAALAPLPHLVSTAPSIYDYDYHDSIPSPSSFSLYHFERYDPRHTQHNTRMLHPAPCVVRRPAGAAWPPGLYTCQAPPRVS